MRAPLTGTKRKDGRWQITVTLTRADGAKIKRTLYADTQREVQAKARVAIATGRTAHQKHSIADLIEIYKADRWPDLAKGTIEQHRPAYKRIIAYFDTDDLRSWDAPKVTRFVRTMEADLSLSGRTVQAYRNVLSTVLTYGRELGWLTDNPAKGITLRKSAKPKDRPRLTPADFQAILTKEPDPVLDTLWSFLGETGMRPREALALQAESIFYSLDLWWIKGGAKTEAGKGREIPLPDALAHRLKERDGWLFPAPKDGRPLNYRFVADLWRVACERAEVGYVNLYQLRKMAISRWLHAGMPDDVIKAMAGHTDIRLTKEVYARMGRDRLMGLFSGVRSVKQSVTDDANPLDLNWRQGDSNP